MTRWIAARFCFSQSDSMGIVDCALSSSSVVAVVGVGGGLGVFSGSCAEISPAVLASSFCERSSSTSPPFSVC